MTLPEYDLPTNDMLDLVKYRMSTLTTFIAMNKGIRDNLLEQGLDMSNLDEYNEFMTSLDQMMQALQEKKNSLENQG